VLEGRIIVASDVLKDNAEIDPGDVAELLARAKVEEVSARFARSAGHRGRGTLTNGKILDRPK
jgi:hypothetical protein